MTSEPVCVADFEAYARERLPKTILEYYNSGANSEQTYADNSGAFYRYRLRPRYMRDVSRRNLSTTILGHHVNFPVGISPMAMCCLAHPDGEVGIAKACETKNACFVLSTTATASLEEINQKTHSCLKWFQAHIITDKKLLVRMIRRAEQNGFTALAVSIDCPVHGRRHAELRNKFTLPSHLKLGNFQGEMESEKGMSEEERKKGWGKFVNTVFDASNTWKDVKWLKTITKLPVVAKGIITAEDAEEALACGVDAIWISNHGGRELDCVPATIDVLSEVVEAVAGRCEVYLDGGVRSGLDVLKALAMGARAVFVGRPALWALTYQGSEGVEKMLQIIKEELDVAMALSGAAKISDIKENMVVHESFYKNKSKL